MQQRPPIVGLHRDTAMLPWPRWPERGAGGNPVEGEARAAGRGVDDKEEGEEKEGLQTVVIDGMGNVLPPVHGDVAVRGQGGRMLRLQRF